MTINDLIKVSKADSKGGYEQIDWFIEVGGHFMRADQAPTEIKEREISSIGLFQGDKHFIEISDE